MFTLGKYLLYGHFLRAYWEWDKGQARQSKPDVCVPCKLRNNIKWRKRIGLQKAWLKSNLRLHFVDLGRRIVICLNRYAFYFQRRQEKARHQQRCTWVTTTQTASFRRHIKLSLARSPPGMPNPLWVNRLIELDISRKLNNCRHETDYPLRSACASTCLL